MVALSLLFLAGFAAQSSAVWLAGVNIAGCDFGMDTSVSSISNDASPSQPEPTGSSH